jgi:hypothetical protein
MAQIFKVFLFKSFGAQGVLTSEHTQPLLLLIQPLADELLQQRLVGHLLQRGHLLQPRLHIGV